MALIGARHGFGIEILVGERGGMAVDTRMLLAAPYVTVAAADLGAAFVLRTVFVADWTLALGLFGRLDIPAICFCKGMTTGDTNAEQQDESPEPSASCAV